MATRELHPDTGDTIQQAIDNAGSGDVIALRPGDYTGQGKVRIRRSDVELRSLEYRQAILGGVELGVKGGWEIPLAHIRLADFVCRGVIGSAVGMTGDFQMGRYQCEDIEISGVEVSDSGGGFGLKGHRLRLLGSYAHTMIQRQGEDCDAIRAWGEDILISDFIAEGINSRVGDAHADGLQCWILDRTNNANQYLRKLTLDDFCIDGGVKARDRGIHQGVILECDGDQITDITIRNGTFKDMLSYAVGFKGAKGTVENIQIINSAAGKAEWSNSHLTSIGNGDVRFGEVSGGTVLYLDSAVDPEPIPEPEPVPEPEPEPEPTREQFPIAVNAANPVTTVDIDAPKPVYQVEDPAHLVVSITDPDFVGELGCVVNGNPILISANFSSEFDGQTHTFRVPVMLGHLHDNKPQIVIFTYIETAGCTIESATFEYTRTEQESTDDDLLVKFNALELRVAMLEPVIDRVLRNEHEINELDNRLTEVSDAAAPHGE